MVEMLMAAFILAFGILGLTMLQTMSLRTARGSQNVGTAVRLAEQFMDQTELEGRLSYLNATNNNYTTPGALSGISYITKNSVEKYFQIDPATGQVVPATGTLTDAPFHLTMTQAYVAGTALSEVKVKVEFTDFVSGSNQKQLRSTTVTRRILHG
jgi:Tfp pilus assembly protein PilV